MKDIEARRKQSRIDDLYDAAVIVEHKYGRDENDDPLDWNEWVILARCLNQVREHGDVSR